MPISITTLFRLLVLGALGAWVFLMYGMARTEGDAFGFSPGRASIAGLFSLAMLIPLVWALTLPDLPEIVARERGRRRFRCGLCPACAYAIDPGGGDRCPECGVTVALPGLYVVSRRSVARFAAMCAVAWLLGCTAAEIWIGADERAFVREAEALLAEDPARMHVSRDRRWPNGDGAIYYRRGTGVVSVEEYGSGVMSDE